MSWVILAFLSAFLVSAAAITQKKILCKEHAMEFSAVLALFNLAFSIPLFFFIDYSTITLPAMGFIFLAGVFGGIAYYLVAKSIRHMELSSSSPFLTLAPGITAILAFFFLGEKLTLLQTGGIILMIAGTYVLESRHGKSIFEPVRELIRSKYIHFILIALVLYGFSSIIDRHVLFSLNLQPLSYLAFAHLFIAMTLLAMLHIFHNGFKDVQHGVRKAGWWILLVALFTIGYRFAQLAAVKVAYVGLVVSIKRTSGFFTTLIGGELFHEHNLVRKSIASVIMVVGAILIVI